MKNEHESHHVTVVSTADAVSIVAVATHHESFVPPACVARSAIARPRRRIRARAKI